MIYSQKVLDNNGHEILLQDYAGKVLLIVNTATHCGLTPQYKELEELYKTYKDKGLEILDFPCNQFLEQAKGSDSEIAAFCETNYGTTFKRFAKIDVNGKNESPLYSYLKEVHPNDLESEGTKSLLEKLKSLGQNIFGTDIKWNFTKFLISKDGKVIKRYSPATNPKDIAKDIENLL